MTGLSRSTVYEVLETLAGWNLVCPTGDGRWGMVAGTSLQDWIAESRFAWGQQRL